MNLQEAISFITSKVKEAGDSCPTTVSDALDDLIKAALQDDKTPLGNAQALSLAASSFGTGGENPDVVVFGDINHFHNFNKQHGQVVGDAAIEHIGKMIKTIFVDDCHALPFRTSGDEFVLLFSSSALEEFKEKVPFFKSCSFTVLEESRETSMSFGYAVSHGEIAFGDVRARAEAACRVAKLQGDGVCVEWTEETEDIESIRGRCASCEAAITGYVPRRSLMECQNILRCPCCGNPLAQ